MNNFSMREEANANESGDSVEITPIDVYNAVEGKLMASLSWLIAKVYGRNIPDALLDPFYRDDNNALHLKPGALYCLTTGELYCAAASAIFHDVGFLNQNHTMVLHTLKRYGIEVVDVEDNYVTETVLTQTAPFKIHAHLAMIDALMTAYFREIINIPRVVNIVKKYTNVHPDETLSDNEDALLFWINKICSVVRDNLEKQKASGQNNVPIIPEMEDLYEDICDGTCILTLFSFYANEQLQLNAISFNDPMSFSDCVHNLRLMKNFCEKNFSSNVFHFNYEDILYTHESFQPNINAFIADLFYFFEGFADIKSPTVTASMTKRHFDRVGIPDLRSLDKENSFRSASSRPNKLSMNATYTAQINRENNNPCNSARTSVMNSTDSLMTIKSCDSLKYHPCAKSANSSNAGTPSATFADFALAKNLDLQQCTGQILNPENRESFILSSEGSSNPSSSDYKENGCSKAPSWSVRLQLDEKRRQIETQQMLAKSERFKQGQLMSKEAFMKLYGKKEQQMKKSIDELENDDLNSEAKTLILSSRGQQQQPATNQNRQRAVEIDQISSSIREIKEQMKRLAFEQEKMQQKLTSSASLLPAGTQNGGHFELNAQSTSMPFSEPQAEAMSFSVHTTQQLMVAPNLDNMTSFAELSPGAAQSTSATEISYHQQHLIYPAGAPISPRTAPTAVTVDASLTESPNFSDRRPASPPNLGFTVGDDDRQDEEISRKKELIVASALRRKRLLDKRKDLTEEQATRKQEELMKKEELEKQRKREKELHRMKIFEEYQRRKAEQLDSEQTTAARGSPPSLPAAKGATMPKTSRPLSQFVAEKSGDARALTGSADNIDQIDGKSQSSDGGGSNSLICEPTVKLFVKPSQKSNRNIIYNAIQYCVLAGSVNESKKQKCLQELAKSDSKHFLVLFRDQKCQFRGLYNWDQVSDTVHKLFGLGPTTCSEKFLQSLFKYDSGAKQFLEIPAKHFSANTDGFTISEDFWQKKKPLYGKSATMK